MRLLVKLTAYAALVCALMLFARKFGEGYTAVAARTSTPGSSSFFSFFALYMLSGVLLAVLASWDISRLVAFASERLIFGGGIAHVLDPRLRRAVRLRKERQALAAISELREHLATHPRDWRTASWIAEIYTHDLNNPLAAALEYEGLLALRLPKSVRPWVMLRLADSHLRQYRGDDAEAMLQELIAKFPRTVPAEKATKRLRKLTAGTETGVQSKGDKSD